MRVFLSSALTIFIFIFFSYIWQFINLPFSNPNEVVGILAEKKINPLNDTVRFIALFTGTVGFFFFIRLYQEKNLFNIDFLFNKSKFSNLSSIKINDIKFVLAFLFIYLYAFRNGAYLDPMLWFFISLAVISKRIKYV